MKEDIMRLASSRKKLLLLVTYTSITSYIYNSMADWHSTQLRHNKYDALPIRANL